MSTFTHATGTANTRAGKRGYQQRVRDRHVHTGDDSAGPLWVGDARVLIVYQMRNICNSN